MVKDRIKQERYAWARYKRAINALPHTDPYYEKRENKAWRKLQSELFQIRKEDK